MLRSETPTGKESVRPLHNTLKYNRCLKQHSTCCLNLFSAFRWSRWILKNVAIKGHNRQARMEEIMKNLTGSSLSRCKAHISFQLSRKVIMLRNLREGTPYRENESERVAVRRSVGETYIRQKKKKKINKPNACGKPTLSSPCAYNFPLPLARFSLAPTPDAHMEMTNQFLAIGVNQSGATLPSMVIRPFSPDTPLPCPALYRPS